MLVVQIGSICWMGKCIPMWYLTRSISNRQLHVLFLRSFISLSAMWSRCSETIWPGIIESELISWGKWNYAVHWVTMENWGFLWPLINQVVHTSYRNSHILRWSFDIKYKLPLPAQTFQFHHFNSKEIQKKHRPIKWRLKLFPIQKVIQCHFYGKLKTSFQKRYSSNGLDIPGKCNYIYWSRNNCIIVILIFLQLIMFLWSFHYVVLFFSSLVVTPVFWVKREH